MTGLHGKDYLQQHTHATPALHGQRELLQFYLRSLAPCHQLTHQSSSEVTQVVFKWRNERGQGAFSGSAGKRYVTDHIPTAQPVSFKVMGVFMLLVRKAFPEYFLKQCWLARSRIVPSKELSNTGYHYAPFTLALFTIVTSVSTLQPTSSENGRRYF